MKITSKGQITIPQDIREQFGLLPHSEVEFHVVGNTLRLRKVAGSKSRGERLLEIMRRAKLRPGMTTDKIMEMTRGE